MNLKPISYKLKQKIIDYYRTSKDNTVPQMSRRFGLSVHQVKRILDTYKKDC